MAHEIVSSSPRGSFTVVLGGARSGKSSLAVRRGHEAELRGHTVTFIATSPRIPGDADLHVRIEAHRAERPSTWRTVEEEIDLRDAISAANPDTFVIVDCVTLWVSNLLHHEISSDGVLAAAQEVVLAVGSRPGPTLLISNEVGLGIVPMNELARSYRDLLGRVNQLFVAASDHAVLMVAGRALPLVDVTEL